MSPTQYLKAQCQNDWTAATQHAFTNALINGTLTPEKMGTYLQQDYLFVDEFVRLLASAIAHAPSLADSIPAAQFLAQITGPENTYFLRSFAALNMSSTAPSAAQTQAFQTLMGDARRSGRYEIMLAVLLVAEWTYLDWATPAAGQITNLPFWLGEWIDLHSGPDFEAVVAYLRCQLDVAWTQADTSVRAEIEQIFNHAVLLERKFFDAAWQGFSAS